MHLPGLPTFGIDPSPAAEAVASSPGFDWTPVVAIVVGIGSALVTGWLQNRQLRTQRGQEEEDRRREERERRHKILVNYERALWEMAVSLEARQDGTSNLNPPDNLDELRAEAYQYFMPLRDTGDEKENSIYWLLFDPGAGPHETAADAADSYTRSNQAARDLLKRFEAENATSAAGAGRQ